MKSDPTPENACKTLPDTGTVYQHIAHALARGYTDLYYVNMDTDEFIEFHTDDEHGVLAEVRRGADFLRKEKLMMGHAFSEEMPCGQSIPAGSTFSRRRSERAAGVILSSLA